MLLICEQTKLPSEGPNNFAFAEACLPPNIILVVACIAAKWWCYCGLHLIICDLLDMQQCWCKCGRLSFHNNALQWISNSGIDWSTFTAICILKKQKLRTSVGSSWIAGKCEWTWIANFVFYLLMHFGLQGHMLGLVWDDFSSKGQVLHSTISSMVRFFV